MLKRSLVTSFVGVFSVLYCCLIPLVNCLSIAGQTESGLIEAADSLIQAMDFTVDPCQDFFQYACGNWIRKNPLGSSKSRWSQIDVVREKVVKEIKIILEQEIDFRDPKPLNNARTMYKACMNTRAIQALGLKPLIDFLANYGGWPIAKNIQEEVNFDWKSVTASLRTVYRISYLIAIYSDLDNYDTERSSIYVDQASLTVPRSMLLNQKDFPKVMQAYAAFISGAAKAVRDATGSGASDAQIESDVGDLLRFEYELAQITSPAEARRDNTRMYNPMLVSEMQSWIDGLNLRSQQANINWLGHFNMIYSAGNIKIPINERVIVVETDYIRNLFILLDRTPTRTVANYVLWRVVRLLSPGTTNQMNNLAVNFSKALYGSPQSEPRSNNCANEINGLLGFAVSAKYIEKNFDENSKTEVETMIKHLKASFETLIEQVDWMDSATKAIAKDKAKAMTALVGYPEWIKDNSRIESYYKGLVVSETEHFANIRNVNTLLARQELSGLRRKTTRSAWITFPSIVNAFYAPKYNSISFPAGILQPPYFGLNGRPAAMNFGGIGTVIGHEITHGFDDRGRQNDKFGNTAPWWTEETLAQYLSRSQCFIDKFNNYIVLNGTRLNGITALGENMADYGGIREAFQAYRSYVAAYGVDFILPGFELFTSEQIFFITFANTHCGTATPERLLNQILTEPHSPNRYRVIGTLSNSEDFVREFNCPVGSPMNQLNKCLLWR